MPDSDVQRRLDIRRRAWLIRDAATSLVQEHTTIDAHRLQFLLDGIDTNLRELYSLVAEPEIDQEDQANG